jgi:hypothetical protein
VTYHHHPEHSVHSLSMCRCRQDDSADEKHSTTNDTPSPPYPVCGYPKKQHSEDVTNEQRIGQAGLHNGCHLGRVQSRENSIGIGWGELEYVGKEGIYQ